MLVRPIIVDADSFLDFDFLSKERFSPTAFIKFSIVLLISSSTMSSKTSSIFFLIFNNISGLS